MRIAGVVLLLILASSGPPWDSVRPPSFTSFVEPAQKACNCDTQCGVCGGRLRGCYNGIPFCECFQC